MAKVTVSGKCSVKPESRVATLWEEYTITWLDKETGNYKTAEKKRPWKLWFDTAAPIADNQWVEVTGVGAWKMADWENETTGKSGTGIEYSLSDVTIVAIQPATLRRDADGDLETAPF